MKQSRNPDEFSSQQTSPPLRSCFRSFWEGRVRTLSRNPWSHFWVALIIAVSLSVTGVIIGDFKVEINNKGWLSRGTKISERHSQVKLLMKNRDSLKELGNEELWQELEETVQPGWQDDDYSSMRRLAIMKDFQSTMSKNKTMIHREASMTQNGCDFEYYRRGPLFSKRRLIAIWEIDNNSPFDSTVIKDICNAEETTQTVLDENDLCVRCDDGKCLPPYSVVSFARFAVQDYSFELSCGDLAVEWVKHKSAVDIEMQMLQCVKDLKSSEKSIELPASCPLGFSPSMVSQNFDSFVNAGGIGREYTSTVFATLREPKKLYKQNSKFDRGNGSIVGMYDTTGKDFQYIHAKESIGSDLALAAGSAIITAIAILIHTRSLMITLVGLLQICLSFPLAYFAYRLAAQLVFFPFLNFIGIFVAFALGADDLFVAVDKWKNARHDNRLASVEEVALVAIPDAASAMFLTSITTAGAFFATAICPIAPLKCFAIFCGLLIAFDYILCIALIVPVLCVYDKWTAGATSTCTQEDNRACESTRSDSCTLQQCCKRNRRDDQRSQNDNDDEKNEGKKEIFIRKVLSVFYNILHRLRWLLLIVSVGSAILGVIYIARNLKMPESSNVPVLRSIHEFARHEEMRQKLLYTLWGQKASSKGYMVWGLKSADTGDHTNPDTFTTLVLDETFDPSNSAAQQYLLEFCDKMFATYDFAKPTKNDYVCPMNRFDKWLKIQSTNSTSSVFRDNCANATHIPMTDKDFHPCFSSWAEEEGVSSVFSRNGIVTIIYIPYLQDLYLYSSYAELDTQWHLTEKWIKAEQRNAPAGVNKFYFSSFEYWWYDTNGNLFATAFVAAGITLCISGVVVLMYFRSLTLTIYSMGTIAYVLLSTTTILVSLGWTIGFIESICLAILIGISCDFVIHLGHAYAIPSGTVSSCERTKHALLVMGPSILAASFTTIAASIIMLFTNFRFYIQFAQILMFTMITATLASIIIFLTLTDCFGPTSFHRPIHVDSSTSHSSPSANRDTPTSLSSPQAVQSTLTLGLSVHDGQVSA